MPKYHLLNWSGEVIERLEGPNDGLVSVESAIWGNFLGTGIFKSFLFFILLDFLL
jgi:hypothetical protein